MKQSKRYTLASISIISLLSASVIFQAASAAQPTESEHDRKVNECIAQFEKINNTVVAGCIEEVLSNTGEKDKAPTDIPELEGLISIAGSYGNDDDGWNLSLTEGEGFYAIHLKKGEIIDTLMVDDFNKLADDHYKLIMEDSSKDAGSSWSMIYNKDTKQFDLKVNTDDAGSDKGETLIFKKNP